MKKYSKATLSVNTAIPLLFAAIFQLFMLNACGDSDSGKRIGGYDGNAEKDLTAAGDSMAILVLCDLSTSIDTSSIRLMADYSGDLVREMPYGSKIAFYPTEDNTMQREIFKCRKPYPRKTSQKYAEKRDTDANAVAVSKAIYKHFEKARKAIDDNKARSCIWSNVAAKISWFDQFPKRHCRYMVIMSDMVEQCNSSPIGSLFLEKAKFTKSKEAQINRYSGQTFTNYPDLKVRCINSSVSYTQHADEYLPTNKVASIWQLIFEKMGYQHKLAYGSEFPDNLPAECHGQ